MPRPTHPSRLGLLPWLASVTLLAPLALARQAENPDKSAPPPAPTSPTSDAPATDAAKPDAAQHDPAAVKLLQQAAEAIRSAQALKFHVHQSGGGLGGRSGSRDITAAVLMLRSPSRHWNMRITGSGKARPSDEKPTDFDVAWIDNLIHYVDHANRKVITASVAAGRNTSTFVAQTLKYPFLVNDAPFRDELAEPVIASEGRQELDGRTVEVVVAGKALDGNRTRLFLDAEDHFPRKMEREIVSKLMNSTTTYTFTEVSVNAPLTAADLEIPVPDGYAEEKPAAAPAAANPQPAANQPEAQEIRSENGAQVVAPKLIDAPSVTAVPQNVRPNPDAPPTEPQADHSNPGVLVNEAGKPVNPAETSATQAAGTPPTPATVDLATGTSAAAPVPAPTPSTAQPVTPPPPTTLPAFDLKDLEGASRTLADLQGRVAVIQFFGTWSGPSRRSHAEFAKLADAHTSSDDVKFLLVSLRERGPQAVRDYAKTAALKMPVLLLGERLAEALQVRVPPTTIVVNRDGTIRKIIPGYHADTTPKEWADALAAALSNAPAETIAVTPADPNAQPVGDQNQAAHNAEPKHAEDSAGSPEHPAPSIPPSSVHTPGAPASGQPQPAPDADSAEAAGVTPAK